MNNDSYRERIDAARKSNLTRQLSDRQIGGAFNKVSAALATDRLYCVVIKDSNTLKSRLNNDSRKCPYLYEAEAIDFTKTLHRTRDSVKRCVMCTRALHPLLNVKNMTCPFCLPK
ncbi:unknown [Spodoptera litura nucleopolyhedrovirus II]|uniref:hypothetical protein n=1 Tax=Spodoptera litura nucleopolyhedrovirus II TaxID=566270 RepID=UPI00018745E0|nr:hypothetical protein SlnV2_gp049 [Spodoptera litura nucleopolyhedrovirus II]ACI47418.1 unknown [Spodoptera litura nucleopolyhedrovirus II]